MHRCALVARIESRTRIVGECEMYKEDLVRVRGDEENRRM